MKGFMAKSKSLLEIILVRQTRNLHDSATNNECITNLMRLRGHISDAQNTFFQVNLGHVVKQYQRWTKLLSRIRPFYAVKCQPDAEVVKVLASLGSGFDCASQEELSLVLNTLEKVYDVHQSDYLAQRKMASESIIFANPFKFKQDMTFADTNGIEMTTFDSEGEMLRLKKYWPSAKLLMRISPRKTFNAKCPLEEKFGVKFKNITRLLNVAKQLQFDVIGLSFHVGCMCEDFSSWPDTVEYCAKITQKMVEIGFNPRILDIGGGFPGFSSIKTEEEVLLQEKFERMCGELNSAVNTFYSNDFTVIAEPGTYFVHGAYTLATEVIGRKELTKKEYPQEFVMEDSQPTEQKVVKKGVLETYTVDNPNNPEAIFATKFTAKDEKRYVYILDDGVYGSFNILQFVKYSFQMLAILTSNGTIKQISKDDTHFISKLYGPTCDTLDCITHESILPELNVGDWLVWADMGAYTNASRSDFNGIPKPDTYYYMPELKGEIMDSVNEKCLMSNLQRKYVTAI